MSHPILERLKKAIKARGFTIKAVSQRLEPSMSPAMLSRALLGRHRLHPDYYDQILDIIGEPWAHFWKQYYEAAAEIPHLGLGDLEPAHLLRLVAGHPVSKPPEFVVQILQSGLPELGIDPLKSIPPSSRELDDLRLVDPESAYERCLKWVEQSAEHLYVENVKPQAVAEAVVALGAFATALRTRGQSRAAAWVLAACFQAVSTEKSGLVMALLLWRSAPMLTDAGYPKLALAHLQQARGIFSPFEDSQEWIGVSISLGIQNTYLANFNAARRFYKQALRHDELDEGYRLIALTNLAKDYERTNQPERAIELVESLEDSLTGSRPSRTSVSARWIKANAAADCGDLEWAAEELAGIRRDVKRYCTAIDPLLLFCDYAKVLLRMGDEKRLKAAAEIALEQLPQLNLDSTLVGMVAEALDRMASRVPRLGELKRLQERLKGTFG